MFLGPRALRVHQFAVDVSHHVHEISATITCRPTEMCDVSQGISNGDLDLTLIVVEVKHTRSLILCNAI